MQIRRETTDIEIEAEMSCFLKIAKFAFIFYLFFVIITILCEIKDLIRSCVSRLIGVSTVSSATLHENS